MAETTTSPKPRRAAAKRAARSSAAKTRTRSTAPKTTARATSSSTRPQTRAARAQQLAERAVLIPVGAALEARDRVTETVGDIVTTTRSRSKLQRQLDHFERRGGSARTQLEREVRRTRSQLERRTRTARRGFERQRTQARKSLDANVEGFASRVEKVVQNGFDTGMKLVNGAQGRLPKVV